MELTFLENELDRRGNQITKAHRTQPTLRGIQMLAEKFYGHDKMKRNWMS